jgi:hypothetical protein
MGRLTFDSEEVLYMSNVKRPMSHVQSVP